MAKYRKKLAVIDAFQYDDDLMGSDGKYYVGLLKHLNKNIMYYGSLKSNDSSCKLFIDILEGTYYVSVGDYLIKRIKG